MRGLQLVTRLVLVIVVLLHVTITNLTEQPLLVEGLKEK